jgi:predicted transcriptional regulator
MSGTRTIRVSGRAEALDRFEAAWHLATGRAAPPALEVLSFADLALLLANLTPARWALLERLRKTGPTSVYALAKALQRDYKNVHTDVARLAEMNLIERTGRNLVRVAWDAVRAELRF